MTTEELTREVTTVTQTRRVLVIHTQPEYAAAGRELKEMRERRSRVVAFFADSKSKAHAAWKAVCENEKTLTRACDAVIDLIVGAMRARDLQLDAERRAEQERLNAAAEAQAAEDRRRMEANARRAATRGNEELATQWQAKAEAVQVLPPIASTPIASAPGISKRWPWKAKVTDMSAFLRQAAENPTLQAFIAVDVNSLARVFGGDHGIVCPTGIELYQEPQYSRR